NAPPSPEERLELAEIAAQSSRAVADLERRIAQAQGMPDSLVCELGVATEQLRSSKMLLHPIRTLSDDVLYEIFICCSPTCLMIPLRTLPPWTISQVSQQWRLVAVSASCLWSSISLYFPS
ncbi:uncharacterized protein BT62DRAFT_830734, partial [Guyanagaster necrorhizus]